MNAGSDPTPQAPEPRAAPASSSPTRPDPPTAVRLDQSRRSTTRPTEVGLTSLRVSRCVSGARLAVGVVRRGPRLGGFSHGVGAEAKASFGPSQTSVSEFPPLSQRCFKCQGSPTLLRSRQPNLLGARRGNSQFLSDLSRECPEPSLYWILKKYIYLMPQMGSLCPVTAIRASTPTPRLSVKRKQVKIK